MKQRRINGLIFRIAAILFIVGLIAGIASFVQADTPPAITTDKTKYSLGETMVISGTGFTRNGAVTITVQQPGNNGVDSLSVTADASGNFIRSYNPPMIPGRYKFDATDGSNAAITAATYADAAKLGADFYGWVLDARTPVYPNWPGDWSKGDLGKNYREGDWVSYVFILANTGTTAANTSDAVNVPPFLANTWGNIYYDFFTASKSGVFVDLLKNFRWALIDKIGGSGKPDNTIISPATANTYFPNTWSPNVLNQPYDVSGHVGTTETQSAPAGKHYFSLDAGAGDLPTSIPADKALVIYFEAHLSITFIWENGLEGEYATHSPSNTQGGSTYAGWTTDAWLGSGATAGSSPHFNYDATGFGAITVPIPIPPAPEGQICGLKYNDLNKDGTRDGTPLEPVLSGWNITISSTIEGIPFSGSTLTGADGTYCFLHLMQGTYTVCETMPTPPPIWTQSEPGAGSNPPYCYGITLAENQVMDHSGINFGNYGCCGVTWSGVPEGGELGCNPTPPACDENVQAFDSCGNELDVTCTPGEIEEDGCLRSQTFEYCATDPCGDTYYEDVTYTWKEDTTDPVLADLPSGGDLGCNPILPVCDTGVTASDNCDGDISADVVCTPGAITDVGTCGKQQIFNYYVEDECGNSDSEDVTYTWKEDTTPPEITCPPDIDMECSECTFDPTYTGWAEAEDNCDGTIIATYEDIYDSGEGCPRSIIREWTATDDCGNSASCTQIIRCYKQSCETACAAQTQPGETRFPGARNWFTYITYNNVGGAEVDYPIYAGKDQLVGTLHVKVEGGVLKVRYEGTDSSGCESVFSEYHLQVERTFNALKTAICNKKDPVPGRCEYKGSPNAPDTGWISTDNVSGWANPIYIFAHSVACSTCYAPLPPG